MSLHGDHGAAWGVDIHVVLLSSCPKQPQQPQPQQPPVTVSWWRGLVPVRFAPDGEARSRPGVTVAGGCTCTEGYWSKLLHRPGRAVLHHGCRITETAYWLHLSKAKVLPTLGHSGSGVEAPAENFFDLRGGADGLTGWGGVVVAGLRRRCGGGAGWLRLCCVSCSSSTWWSMSLLCRSSMWVSSFWTRLPCPLLCKTGFWSRQCSPWCPAAAVLGQGGDMPVVATTGAFGFFVQKTVEVPQLQCLSMSACAVHVPVIMQRRFWCSSWTRSSSCPLRADSWGPDVQKTALFHSCSSRQVVDVPVIKQRRLRSGSATDSVHRQTPWTFQLCNRFAYGGCGGDVWMGVGRGVFGGIDAFFRAPLVVPELSASFWSPQW